MFMNILKITNYIVFYINQSNPFYSPFSFTKGWALVSKSIITLKKYVDIVVYI